MSLKAKIEAIIYAAEEPVTLSQLAGLLGVEAQGELDREAEQQGRLALAADEEATDGIPAPSDRETTDGEVLPEGTERDDTTEQNDNEVADGPAEATEDERSPEIEQQPAAAADGAGKTAESAAEERRQLRRERERERVLRDYFRRILAELIADYAKGERGLEIREVASGYRLATKPEYHDAVRGFAKGLKPPLKLSLQALETLAVVAYKQPVTAPEVSEIRGVDSGGVLGSLITRKLVTTAGRKQVIGRPILYKTTKEFLLRFGLKDVGELPSIEEFEKMAGELTEPEPRLDHLEESEMAVRDESVTGANLLEEENATEPQADGDSEVLETLPVDGRISAPSEREPANVDSPAGDAAMQQDERSARLEGRE